MRKELVRTVVTTDGEVDDMNSVLRLLLYANEIDIAGIVLTSSMYHYAGNGKDIKPLRWTGTNWIWKFFDDYEKVYDNLVFHDSRYPSADYFRSVTKIGNISNAGEMEEVTEGSQFLKELFLDEDTRDLYVQTWGGTNTTARALKSIEEEYKDTKEWKSIQKKINEKLIIYIILDQDDSYKDYIAKSWPDIRIINDVSNFWHFAYAWKFHDDALNSKLHGNWCYENFVKDKGVFMANYALIGDGKTLEGEDYEELRGTEDYLKAHPEYDRYDFISEGDSPSFLYLVDRGLRSLENPSFGGWGGRFGIHNPHKNTALDYNPYSQQFEASYSLTRWFDDIQNDFANRIEWTLTKDSKRVNYLPALSVLEGIDICAKPGEVVTLTAVSDANRFKWWRYFEADTYQDGPVQTKAEIKDMGIQLDITRTPGLEEKLNTIEIKNADSAQMHFTVPMDAKTGDTIHMVIEVQSSGNYPLKRYQRVIVSVY